MNTTLLPQITYPPTYPHQDENPSWRKRGSISETERAPLLFGIANKKIVDHYRARGRQLAVLADHELLAMYADPSAEDDFIVALSALSVEEILSWLTSKQREALVLVHIDGVNQQRAADMMGISKSSLRQHLELAKKKLFRRLGQTVEPSSCIQAPRGYRR